MFKTWTQIDIRCITLYALEDIFVYSTYCLLAVVSGSELRVFKIMIGNVLDKLKLRLLTNSFYFMSIGFRDAMVVKNKYI